MNYPFNVSCQTGTCMTHKTTVYLLSNQKSYDYYFLIGLWPTGTSLSVPHTIKTYSFKETVIKTHEIILAPGSSASSFPARYDNGTRQNTRVVPAFLIKMCCDNIQK